MFNDFDITKVLIIAPKRVAEDTWEREIEKWDHLKHLRLSKVLGNPAERKKALETDSDIYITNRENTKWLIDFYRQRKAWPFDMLVVDELSSFKSTKSQRFKALKIVTPLFKRVVGLTGTPTPNGYMDLWSQMYLLDRGERLGKTITGYRERYFTPGRRNGYTVFDWQLKEGAEKAIQEKIKDICVSMDAKDYLDLPERINNNVYVNLVPKAKALYQKLEKELILEEEEITALTAATLTNKLLQLANGAVYTTEKEVLHIHDEKLIALEEILEFNETPILVFYNFKHDYTRLMEYFKDLRPRALDNQQDIADWNAGKIRLLLCHPASVGHGLNIQAGGHTIVWFGLTWSLELYQQANARLDRQGQDKNVIVHHLIAKGTEDENVMKVIERKDMGQTAFLESVKARIEKYRRDNLGS